MNGSRLSAYLLADPFEVLYYIGRQGLFIYKFMLKAIWKAACISVELATKRHLYT
jgi:hypothetical protein